MLLLKVVLLWILLSKNNCFMKWFLLICMFVAISSCTSSSNKKVENTDNFGSKSMIPTFSADSAYAFVKQQCDFGSRVPGSDAHAKCKDYFIEKFKQYKADSIIVQEGTESLYDSRKMPLYNIIASYNLEQKNRILICAHWDSRPFSDQDSDKNNYNKAIDGANDGASGVGVIIELARLLSENEPSVGVDLVLFDLEDYGVPEGEESNLDNGGWTLGSKYWKDNYVLPSVKPKYGILLDMVGAPNATFYREYLSDRYSAWVVNKIWSVAEKCGYANVFVNKQGGAVTDDHINVYQAGIPCVDIIHFEPSSEHGFGFYWHTQNDNINNISATTLGIVGDVLVHLIFE